MSNHLATVDAFVSALMGYVCSLCFHVCHVLTRSNNFRGLNWQLQSDKGTGRPQDETLREFRQGKAARQLAEGWINVTHYVRLDENIDHISKQALFEFFCEGAAIQGTHNQFSWDICITVYKAVYLFSTLRLVLKLW